VTGKEYRIFGYGGKQVRDNIHSSDLVRAFHEVIKNPKPAKVYNLGGGRESNCSMQEAVEACEARVGKRLNRTYASEHRIGDHQWYISNLSRFKADYPEWGLKYTMSDIFDDVYRGVTQRVTA
jgi:CDP-paratose 2-epimerase